MTKQTNLPKRRRVTALVVMMIVAVGALWAWQSGEPPTNNNNETTISQTASDNADQELALSALAKIVVKRRDSSNGYTREQFGGNWAKWSKCDVRQQILNRDLTNITLGDDGCTVLTGTLNDPYTAKIIDFTRGQTTSNKVQIDHVVAISNAWQTGAQELSADERKALYNDPLELIAVDGPTNGQKSDGDAAEWLPPNKAFRCVYIARQIAVKIKYRLWVTNDERNAMTEVLNTCPEQRLPAP